MAAIYNCSQIGVYGKIGKGGFGTVYKGSIGGKTVAIKINEGDKRGSQREINRLRRLDHHRVIKFLGSVPTDRHFSRQCECDEEGLSTDVQWIIMEYIPKGDLYSYISNYTGGVPAHGMIKIASQVAEGMRYLHKDANVVHMDLAARNVLVKDDAFNVKIADFGLLCDYNYAYFENHYYQDDNGNACPVRWMPPENLPAHGNEPSYTRKGDIWSFGVLLFEIWSRGKLPFSQLSNEEVMDAVCAGYTVLDYNKIKARNWVLELMKECFQFKPQERKNFRWILENIQENM